MTADMLNIAKSGISSSRKSMATTAHNISNVNTEGYSRQRALQQNRPPVGSGNVMIGTGSHISHVKRIHSEYVEKRLTNTLSEQGYFEQRASQLEMIENIFNEVNNDGLTKSMNAFFNSFKQLSNQPESTTIRSMVRESAKILVRDFQRMRRHLNHSVRSIDKFMEESVADINYSLEAVAKLNVKINSLENAHGESGDLRDERDVQVRNLARYFELDTYADDQGRYVINVKGFGTLVAGDKFWEMKTGSVSDKKALVPGSLDIIVNAKPIGKKLKKGIIKALLDVKKNELTQIGRKLDGLAHVLANAVNHIHSKGQGLRPIMNYTNFREKTTGHKIFDIPPEVNRASEYISLSPELMSSLDAICAGLKQNSPGDNTVALAVGKLSDIPLMDNGTKTFEDYYLEGVGALSLATNKAKINSDQTKGVLAQTQALRERISGVSLDEETTNMIKHQKQFEAAAKVMSTAEDMMRAILNIKK
jgi:flagellar hook-associated protein 1